MKSAMKFDKAEQFAATAPLLTPLSHLPPEGLPLPPKRLEQRRISCLGIQPTPLLHERRGGRPLLAPGSIQLGCRLRNRSGSNCGLLCA